MEQVAVLRMRTARHHVVVLTLLSVLASALVVAMTPRPARASGGISYVTHYTKANDAKSKSLKIGTPAKTQAGDLMIAAVYVRGKPKVTGPSGWTFVRHNGRGRLYYRVADGNEKDTYTWTLSESHNAGGTIMVYRGVDPANPIDDDTGAKHTDKSTSIEAPSAMSSEDDARVVGFFGTGVDSSIDPPSEFTERADKRSKADGIKPLAWEISDKTKSSPGDTGDKTAKADQKDTNVGQLLILNPGSAPPPDPGPGDPNGVYRAFDDSSYWNTPLPAGAPADPNSGAIMAYIQSDATTDYVYLSGTGSSGDWGQPIFWATAGDPTYDVKPTGNPLPPEFDNLRIPRDAKTDDTSDAPLTVYDLDAGYVSWLWDAAYDPGTDTWSAGGGSIHYLASNGLDNDWIQYPDTDPRNTGHRGVAGAVFPVRYDEIAAGAIAHVLKIGVHHTACAHVFPMVGDECGTEDPYAPPEGTRIRIKRSVDLSSFGLSPEALVVAQALQTYGAVIGDQSGGQVSMKVENVVVEGRGWLWDGLLTSTSLSAIPLSDYEVIQLGWAPP